MLFQFYFRCHIWLFYCLKKNIQVLGYLLKAQEDLNQFEVSIEQIQTGMNMLAYKFEFKGTVKVIEPSPHGDT